MRRFRQALYVSGAPSVAPQERLQRVVDRAIGHAREIEEDDAQVVDDVRDVEEHLGGNEHGQGR